MNCLHLTDTEIDQLIRDYPCESIEHQAGLDLVYYQQERENKDSPEELEDALRDEARYQAAEAQNRIIAQLEAALKELATHVRTNDGRDCIHRLKVIGLLK